MLKSQEVVLGGGISRYVRLQEFLQHSASPAHSRAAAPEGGPLEESGMARRQSCGLRSDRPPVDGDDMPIVADLLACIITKVCMTRRMHRAKHSKQCSLSSKVHTFLQRLVERTSDDNDNFIEALCYEKLGRPQQARSFL